MSSTGAAKTRSARRGFRSFFALTLIASVTVVVPAFTAPAPAVTPAHVQFTLEGCRGSAGSFPANGPFVCPDAEYTTGNLGSGWNELDLVPHRVTTVLGTQAAATTTYSFNIVADHLEFGVPGYDVISEPVVNVSKSDGSCKVSSTGQLVKTPGIGGTDSSIYRTVTVTQNKGTTCVLDYYERLALGSAGFPGSSLHSNLTQVDFSTGGIGARDVSIPVKEILPQSISKDMTATQGSDHVWNITKSATPAVLTFEDTCATGPGARQKSLSVTIQWTKLPASPSGDITIVTNVYATNPSHRLITVSVTDVVRSGTTPVTPTSGSNTATATVDVPANSTVLVLTHTLTVASGTTDLNDVATATYTDKATGVPVPGTTTATASATVQQTGPVTNATAVITDTEDISGDNLSFSVDAISPDGVTASIKQGASDYKLGAVTKDPIDWTSVVQSGSGSVTFTKTVYADEPAQTTGTLEDTATVTGSDGFTASARVSVGISATAEASLTVSKTIPFVLGTGESVSFTFKLLADGANPSTAPIATETVTFTAGEGGTGRPKTATFTGLAPNTDYDLYEVVPTGWVDPGKIDVKTAPLPACATEVELTNGFAPAAADATKVADPASGTAGWVFTLRKGTTVVATGTSAADGSVSWDLASTTGTVETLASVDITEEGDYSITETAQSGWDLTGVSSTGDGTATPDANNFRCTFTVNFPADFGKTFSCEFRNRQRGQITVVKTLNGQRPPADASFTFDLRTGASAGVPGTIVTPPGTVTLNDGNNFTYTWTNLVPGTYQLCESGIPAGGKSSLEDDPNSFAPSLDNSTICVPVTLGAGGDVRIDVDNQPPPGGNARTIGYWRNWASCSTSKGKQAPVLDQTLAIAEGQGGLVVSATSGTWPAFGGTKYLVLGSGDCAKAVKLLSKQSLSGAKKASDPLFNMAAQLVAAQLNYFAGAQQFAATTSNINKAVLLLGKYAFNGNGYTGTLSAADKNLARCLATQLDNYNNNDPASAC